MTILPFSVLEAIQDYASQETFWIGYGVFATVIIGLAIIYRRPKR